MRRNARGRLRRIGCEFGRCDDFAMAVRMVDTIAGGHAPWRPSRMLVTGRTTSPSSLRGWGLIWTGGGGSAAMARWTPWCGCWGVGLLVDLLLVFVFVGWRQAARWKIYDLSLSRLAEQVILDSLRIWVRLG